MPVGEVGELLVRGPGILQGYYRKPEATAAAFWGDWFRTGDLFRQDERGYLYILGRTKDMVRRAGENIAAREVESILLELPEIAECAVVPVPDDTRGEEVKAYLVLQPGLTAADLPRTGSSPTARASSPSSRYRATSNTGRRRCRGRNPARSPSRR